MTQKDGTSPVWCCWQDFRFDVWPEDYKDRPRYEGDDICSECENTVDVYGCGIQFLVVPPAPTIEDGMVTA